MPLELEERERFRFYKLGLEEKLKILEKIREELERREEIKLAIVYGSFLKSYSFRDIDIAVYVVTDRDLLDYKFELEDELEDKISYPVGIAILNEAPSWFVRKVLREGKVLVQKQPLLAEKLYLKALDEEYKCKNSHNRAEQH